MHTMHTVLSLLCKIGTKLVLFDVNFGKNYSLRQKNANYLSFL